MLNSAGRTSTNPTDRAGVILPPPLIYLLGLAAGFGMEQILPTPRVPFPLNLLVGLGVVTVAMVLIFAAALAFHRASTPVNPYESTTALVQHGIFRFSRNPIYLAFALIYVGLALGIGPTWPIIVFPLVLWAVRRGVIDREERYLAGKFGEAYRRYCAAVRRWV